MYRRYINQINLIFRSSAHRLVGVGLPLLAAISNYVAKKFLDIYIYIYHNTVLFSPLVFSSLRSVIVGVSWADEPEIEPKINILRLDSPRKYHTRESVSPRLNSYQTTEERKE